MSDQYVFPMRDEDFKEVRPGFRRRILTGNGLMLCFWRIEEGRGPTPYDGHAENEQFGVVLRGELDFRIGSSERSVLRPGDAYWAPVAHPHGDSHFRGDKDLGETWILDVFAPPREEYRDG